MSEEANFTQLLNKAQMGDKDSLDKLLPIVYNELRRVAQNQLNRERSNHTLQATALVHEAYMRLIDQRNVNWENRKHFFSIASEMMRRILVNYAVERNAQKRGDGVAKISLDDVVSFPANEENEFDLVVLDDALKRLEEMDKNQAKIVELRFFGGLTNEEIAELTDVSLSTVKREWRMAKAWLRSQL